MGSFGSSFGGLGLYWGHSAALEQPLADLGPLVAVLGPLLSRCLLAPGLFLGCAWVALRSLLADLGALWGFSWDPR